MKKLINLILSQSFKDLLKYKSFLLLIFVLILADRFIKYVTDSKKTSFAIPEFDSLSMQAADYVFTQFPESILNWLTDYRTLIVIVLLFLLKQLISMWPSSDMRRMHRLERENFGLISSLIAIHGRQVIWDAIAVGTIVGITIVWLAGAFLVGLLTWNLGAAAYSLYLFATISGLVFPITMAGFSFSSKLAVISTGSFSEKLRLFFELLLSRRVFLGSWVFYSLRIIIEAIFVFILPLTILWAMENVILRITIAGLIATPFYSFLKMASFKFFLYIYKPYPLVKAEYQTYYTST